MIRGRLITFASVLACVFATGAHAQSQQPVAFIGDELTYQWGQQPQFVANALWAPDGSNVQGAPGHAFAGTSAALTALQTIIASGKKPIIHLMAGEADSEAVSPGNEHSVIFAGWAQNFEQIITTAQQAGLKIIVGTIPYSNIGDVSDMNQWIFVYCSAHNIPVVNYAYALGSPTGSYYTPAPPGIDGIPQHQLTSQGYALITDMAQTAILLTEGYRLQGGYLDTLYSSHLEDAQPVASANTGVDGGTVQFTAYGQYSDGSTHVINNADSNGHIGTFTTSSASVLAIDQNGVGTALDAGTANIHFTTLAGQTLSEWGWTTEVFDKCGCTHY